jgi:GNAT superfamily N-acetyltransferase
MDDTRFATELARNVQSEIAPIVEESWKELKDSYSSSKLRPDVALYMRLEEQGLLKVFTARHDDMLVGYALVLVMAHPHRTDDLVGAVDTIFVLPEFRFGGTASRFLHYVEAQLKLMGVCLLSIVSRDARIARWLQFSAYKPVEQVYERRL